MRDRWLTVRKLMELLATIPSDAEVTPNTVGNLLGVRPDGSVFAIDFMAGEIETWGEDDAGP